MLLGRHKNRPTPRQHARQTDDPGNAREPRRSRSRKTSNQNLTSHSTLSGFSYARNLGDPMRYMGGKGRIAKKLSETIMNHAPSNSGTYWEPFVGGGAMASRMGRHFEVANYSDIHPDLILMWQKLNEGWEPPTIVPYDQYQELRYATEPSAFRGFVGFGGSFGGRWFEGYARGGENADGTPRNHQGESARAVMKDIQGMRAKSVTNFDRLDALRINPQPGDVVYCDPPYAGTKNYSKTDRLDHAEFWRIAEQWARNGAHVFVSEYSAPTGWESIWEQPLRSSVRVGSEDRHMTTERLFTFSGKPMTKLKLGEVCAGYGGLGLAVESVFDAELSWYSEFEESAEKIMQAHWPDVPNHGDMTAIDWPAVEPVDILSGGTPCQDLSQAGRRKGMTEGTRSNLWVAMREAIAIIKPTYVVWENVRGAYSAKADSEMEHCPGCMGTHEQDGKHFLRALGRVLGDLSDLGYDTQWRGLPASSMGAPHARYRVFILATRRGATENADR